MTSEDAHVPSSAAPQPPYRDPSLSPEERAADLLQRMTLEEKLAQLMGWGEWGLLAPGAPYRFTIEVARQACPHGLGWTSNFSLRRGPREAAELANSIQHFLVEETRLGIPAVIVGEALHGFMAKGSTSFPQAIGLASTWDPDLVEAALGVAALEMRARGTAQAFTPVLDLAREPRWGRTEETYGEDPYLVARMGVAAIRGLQGRGPGIAQGRVLATAKHFAAHGQPEGGTNAAPANFAERVLREQFLVPFQAAVTEAGAASVMASYNEINGIPSHANPWLLRQVLRDEWGFDGLLISDAWGVDDLVRLHHVAATPAEAARKALLAGVDQELGGRLFETLREQVEDGRLPQAAVDAAVARVLRAKFALGLFEAPYVDPDEAERATNCSEHQALALRAAREAIVLLKNEGGALPWDLSALRAIAVIGPNAAGLHLGGYSGDPGDGVSVLAGIRARVGAEAQVFYAEGCRISEGVQGWEAWHLDAAVPSDPAEDAVRIAEAVKAAQAADVALVVVGDNESTCREAWAPNHPGDRDDLALLGRQEELVRAVVATGTPTVVLFINGRPISSGYVAEHVPAVLEGWYLGQATGTVVAEVLFGDVNPGGKLPITIPRSAGQLPAYYYRKPSAKRGYLWSDTAPLFAFGHGLSYTTFSYDHLRVTPERIHQGEQAVVRVDVTNTGARAGDEVVQLYLRDQVSSATRPVKELKGFRRITLQPGETRTVEFVLGQDELAFLDADMRRVVEPGLFDVMVGTSSTQVMTEQLEVVD